MPAMNTYRVTNKQQDKLISAAQDAITFTVTGNGDFPIDMLRYDRCWPDSQQDAAHLNYPHLSLPKPGRTITLKGLKIPTVARWKSFGWRVVEVNKEVVG